MPTFGRKLPKGPGAPRLTGRRKQAADLLEQLAKVGGGRGTMQTPAGPQIAQPGTITRLGRTPAGGLPAAVGSAAGTVDGVTDAGFSQESAFAGTIQEWDTTFQGWNVTTGAVAGSTLIPWIVVDGVWMPLAGGGGEPEADAIVVVAITAASGKHYGTGEARIYTDDGTSTGIPDPNYPDPVIVKSWFIGGSVAVNTHIEIARRGEAWRLLSADCAPAAQGGSPFPSEVYPREIFPPGVFA